MVRKFAALSSGEAPVRAVSCQRAALMLVVHLALGSLSSIVTGNSEDGDGLSEDLEVPHLGGLGPIGETKKYVS